MEIESISGQTVTFTTPFHIEFDTAHKAELSRFDEPAVKNAGVEDLHLHGGGNDNLTLSLAAYSWVKNVESEYSSGSSVGLSVAFRCVVHDSYFHHSPHLYPGGGSYGLSVSSGSADNLIENNIFWHFNKVMVMQASGGGNVIGYNYFEDGFIGTTPRDYTDWMETGMNAAHMTCPHYELFEGNQAFNIDADADWGNSVYITYFRNHATERCMLVGLRQHDVRQNAAVPGRIAFNNRSRGLVARRFDAQHDHRLAILASVPVPALVSFCSRRFYKRRNRRALATY